jgi:hypothetical protein
VTVEWSWDAAPTRVEGVEVTQVADGYIVYQADRERVHYLNHTAAIVLELCTGAVHASEMPAFLQQAYQLAAPPTDEVAECLTQLYTEGLVR